MNDKLIINKKSLKGEDGYKTFSIRIKEETVSRLDELSKSTNRSRNELINILLDFAIDHSEVKPWYIKNPPFDENGFLFGEVS